MHTSKLLRASDFQYWRLAEDKRISIDFEGFCPDYHELDRVGVISPYIEDGILYTGDALLALTTAFYDVLRITRDRFLRLPATLCVYWRIQVKIPCIHGVNNCPWIALEHGLGES